MARTETPDLDRVTPVIFRKFSNGEVIALFPFHAGSNDPDTCQSYMLIGQHDTAHRSVVRCTKPASADEPQAQRIIRELTGAPFCYPTLTPVRGFTPADYREREAQVAR